MSEMFPAVADQHTAARGRSGGVLLRSIVIGLTAFLTVVDLFATQAILPRSPSNYGVSPAAMGFAVDACTLGMAVAGLAVGYFSREIDRRKGILISLVLLSIPTALLAHAPDLTSFTVLRVAQGLCMPPPSLSRWLISASITAPAIRRARLPPTSPATSPAT